MSGAAKPSPEELLAIGEILRPRGVRGELKVRLLCGDFDDFLECLDVGDPFLWWGDGDEAVEAPPHPRELAAALRVGPATAALSSGAAPQAPPKPPFRRQSTAGAPYLMPIESVRFHAGFALLTAKGVETLEAAESLRGARIGLPASRVPQPQEDSFYQFDLIGLRVLAADGTCLGSVDEVVENPAHDLLRVHSDDPRWKPFLLPLVAVFVKRVDLEKGEILVDLPDGLREPA